MWAVQNVKRARAAVASCSTRGGWFHNTHATVQPVVLNYQKIKVGAIQLHRLAALIVLWAQCPITVFLQSPWWIHCSLECCSKLLVHCNLCRADYISYMDSFSCNTDFYYHVVSLMSLLPFRHFLVAIATGYPLLFVYWDVCGVTGISLVRLQVCTRMRATLRIWLHKVQ